MADEDATQLKLLNQAVEAAIAERTAWLDSKMPTYAKYAVGEELFDLDSGRCLGTVDKHYRYWADQNPIYDTSLSIEYRLHTGNNCYDNTSRHAGRISFGNRAELERREAK